MKNVPFWPLSFRLPQEYEKMKEYFQSKGNVRIPFILKPPNASRGNKIQLTTHVDDIDIESEFIKTEIPIAQE